MNLTLIMKVIWKLLTGIIYRNLSCAKVKFQFQEDFQILQIYEIFRYISIFAQFQRNKPVFSFAGTIHKQWNFIQHLFELHQISLFYLIINPKWEQCGSQTRIAKIKNLKLLPLRRGILNYDWHYTSHLQNIHKNYHRHVKEKFEQRE